MKRCLILAFTCAAAVQAFGAPSILSGRDTPAELLQEATATGDSNVAGVPRTDSTAVKVSMVPVPGYFPLSISVLPVEAADAAVAVEKRSTIEILPNAITTYWILPELLGTWEAPVTLFLPAGNYRIVATKPGYKPVWRMVALVDSLQRPLSLSMLSRADLERVREQWSTCKWVSAAVATAAGIATLYFHERISSYRNEYDNALLPALAEVNRNHVTTYQSLFHVSSTIACAAVAGFLVAWFLEAVYGN